jgi:hypothetical protein
VVIKVGPYEVAGGMREVYRAPDPRVNRGALRRKIHFGLTV